MNPRTDWTPDSWRRLHTDQQPTWPDLAALNDVIKRLAGMPPLIFAGEARSLTSELARAQSGDAFVLQAGDCAETFEDFSADRVKNVLKVILQMSAVLAYSSGVPTIRIGRVAGQFAKPRTVATETVDGEELPTYRGDIINRVPPDRASRTPDAANILRAYEQAASTLNLLRGFTKGGFADLASVHEWNREFLAASSEGHRYEAIASGIDAALRFMRVCGVDSPSLHEVDFYASHEALLLPYEEALTRQDSTHDDDWYDCSAHMLWVGNRTRELDHAHVEFLSGINNPVGCKIDSNCTPQYVLELCDRLNPARHPGRLTLISRMGCDRIVDHLPPIIDAVNDSGHRVLWMCDPMHGNTFKSDGGLKTRRFEDIFEEISRYFSIHRAAHTWPGGIHLELTGENVTECLGGPDDLEDHELHAHYETACDPRLNARQSLDLAFLVAELLADFPPPATTNTR
jgi:3-deoxy-7-phosphoheptulonate synthase